MLRSQLKGRPAYEDYQGIGGMPNAHGITPEEYQADKAASDALQEWQAQQSYMGNGMSDLMNRTPPRKLPAMRKERPSPYMRKETGSPKKSRAVGID